MKKSTRLKNNAKAKLYFALGAGLHVLAAAIQVSFAFGLQMIIEAATEGSVDNLIFGIWVCIGIMASQTIVGLIGVRCRVMNISEMLVLSKANRMALLFARRLKTPADDNSNDLSFFTADIDMLDGNYHWGVFNLIRSFAVLVLALASMFWINWMLTLAVLAASSIPVLTTLPFAKGLNRRTKAYSDQTADYVDTTRECIQGQRDIMAFDKQAVFLDRHNKANRQVERARANNVFFRSMSDYVSSNSASLVVICAIGLGSYLVITGDLTFGMMVAMTQLIQSVVGPATGIASGINSVRSTKALREKAAETAPDEPKKDALHDFAHAIEIKGLGLKYDDENYVIQNLDLSFKKGGKYAVLAPSGFGKSSIAKAIAMEFMEFDGSITIDGKDIRGIDTGDYNKLMRFVRQDPFLFNDTALNNLTFFEENPDEAEFDAALNITRVRDFLADNEALNRHVSNTSGLSGGQKQRMVLARALLHKPKILVLDEITSGVDLETARDILQDLFFDENLTVIAITHERDERFLGLFDEVVELGA